ncbi:hypothetical protein BGZ73_000275, partial [Actinomortierella ambigua]
RTRLATPDTPTESYPHMILTAFMVHSHREADYNVGVTEEDPSLTLAVISLVLRRRHESRQQTSSPGGLEGDGR